MSSCPACSGIVGSAPSVFGATQTCVPCGLAFLAPFSAAQSAGTVYFHPYSAHADRLCPACGGGMVARDLLDGKHSVIGWHCSRCDWFVMPLAALLRAGRGDRDPRTRPVAERPPSREPAEIRTIDERDRIFAFLLVLPIELSDRIDRRPPGTSALIGICSLLFLLEVLFGVPISGSWALQTDEVGFSTLWQLPASIFVHWSLLHLLGNLYFLFSFGRLPESRLGAMRLVGLFLATGLAGNLVYLLLNYGEPRILGGASGSVSGLLGFYFAMFPRHRVGVSLFFKVVRVPALVYMGLWFSLQLVDMTAEASPVAYSVHVVGFLAGAALGILFKRTRPIGE